MILSESNKKRLQELANIVNEKGGAPRTVSLTSKKSGKYRNPKGPAKYFAAYNNLKETSSKDIKLPAKYIHDNLNQEIWNGIELKPKVAKALKVIAKDFYDSLETDVPIKDIWFTGSLANYNWTNFSDIDLHILLDFKKIGGDEEFAFECLDAKKDVWLAKHDIKIKGFEVEPYAQDIHATHDGMNSIYSIKDDEWIQKPSLKTTKINKKSIKNKIKKIVKKIEDIEAIDNLEKSQSEGKILKKKITKMRQSGLSDSGEFSEGNLVFKYLRNNGFIERLFDKVRSSYDKSVSIDENDKSSSFKYNEDENLILSDEVLSITKLLHKNKKDFSDSGLEQKILKFPFYKLEEIPTSTASNQNIDYNSDLVDKYVEKTKFNPDYPPIIFDSERQIVIDGTHRVKALEELGYDSIRAYVGINDESSNSVEENYKKNMNESIRKVVRSQINEFFNSKGFHASMEDWLKKWGKKGVEIDANSYGDGMDMGIPKKETILSEEEFASKAQQRYFYAMANKSGKKGKQWKKWAKEFSDDTNFKSLPEKVNETDVDSEVFQADNKQKLQNIANILYGMGLDEENASSIFLHKDKIYVPISNFDGYDKKDFQRAALERGYNVSVNGPNFIIDLSNPAFSLNESIVTDEERSWLKFLDNANTQPANDPKLFVKNAYDAGFPEVAIVDALQANGGHDKDSAETYYYNIIGQHVDSINENIEEEKSKNHNLFLEKNINDEHGQNSEDFKEFVMFCCDSAGINLPTKIYLRGTRDEKLRTTASYNPNSHDIHVYCKGRHMVDVMRSVAHELMHMKQGLDDRLYDNSGDDGSNEENEAHSFSGLMIRKFGRERPKIYEGYSKGGNLI